MNAKQWYQREYMGRACLTLGFLEKINLREKKNRRMGSMMSSSSSQNQQSTDASEAALTKAKDLVSSNPVVVFSKTYCGYCTKVKQLLNQLGAPYKLIELDRDSDGSDVQAALAGWTGQRTVPNVFIGQKHIGGCDSVMAKHQQGKLVPLLTDAGALATKSAHM